MKKRTTSTPPRHLATSPPHSKRSEPPISPPRHLTIWLIIFALLLIAPIFATLGPAPTLPVDSRKVPMQFFRDFEFTEVAPSDTIWVKVTLPPKTVAVQLLSLTDSVAVIADTLDAAYRTEWKIGEGLPGLIISTFRGPTTLPVFRKTAIWVRRSVKSTASKVRILFFKM